MKLDIFNWLVTFFCLLSDCEAAKILAIIPFRVDSHFPIFENLLKGLVARGHQVVAVSHYPQKNPIENFTDISLVGSLPSTKDNVSLGSIEAANSGLFISFFLGFATSACKIVYEHPQVKQLLERENEFDLVINEIWGNDCFLALTHKFKIPHIGIITSVAYPWSNDRVANPDNPSYIPNFFLPYSDRMSFYERLTNLVFTVGAKYLHYFMSERPTHQIASQHFSDLPPLSEIARTTSLIFVNSHFSINHPRPGFIEVAGLHIKDSKPLPQHTQMFSSL
ncbi:hypothetical protein C0J52_17345 [Blattella germanica]|nr:hypothetical protein C0J52_17345 [Blattella germanica]